jgi:hypothetical protein
MTAAFRRIAGQLVSVARWDAFTLADHAQELQVRLGPHQKPQVHRIEKHEAEEAEESVLTYILQQYSALADTQPQATPSLVATPALAFFLQIANLLLQQCCDLLDYSNCQHQRHTGGGSTHQQLSC